jgi:hypothetical protein
MYSLRDPSLLGSTDRKGVSLSSDRERTSLPGYLDEGLLPASAVEEPEGARITARRGISRVAGRGRWAGSGVIWPGR